MFREGEHRRASRSRDRRKVFASRGSELTDASSAWPLGECRLMRVELAIDGTEVALGRNDALQHGASEGDVKYVSRRQVVLKAEGGLVACTSVGGNPIVVEPPGSPGGTPGQPQTLSQNRRRLLPPGSVLHLDKHRRPGTRVEVVLEAVEEDDEALACRPRRAASPSCRCRAGRRRPLPPVRSDTSRAETGQRRGCITSTTPGGCSSCSSWPRVWRVWQETLAAGRAQHKKKRD